jgi:hypothetical protein
MSQAVDWSNKSVGELRAFLRAQGVDLRGLLEKPDLVQAAMALAPPPHQPEGTKEGFSVGNYVVTFTGSAGGIDSLSGLLRSLAGGCDGRKCYSSTFACPEVTGQ